MIPQRALKISALTIAVGLGLTATAKAQPARITAVQAVAQKNSVDNPAWVNAPVGADLRTGDKLRTGKRSKSDVKFTDGSLIRLGQLSTLEIDGDRQAKLAGGQLLFSFLKPGRIVAGAAAAEIKGTVGIITVKDDKSVEYALYSGSLDVVSALEKVHLKPGQEVTVSGTGNFSAIGHTAPLEYAGGSFNPDLLTTPNNAPYVGSFTDLADRNTDEQVSVGYTVNQGRTVGFGVSHNPGNLGAPGNPGTILPFPTPVANPVPTPFPTLPPGFSISSHPSFTGRSLSVPTVISRPDTQQDGIQNSGSNEPKILLASTAVGSTGTTGPVTTGSIPGNGPQPAQPGTETAEQHLNDASYSNGESSGMDIRFLGAYGEDGDYADGARIHGYAVKGHWFLDGAFTPLRVATNYNGTKVYTNLTPVTDLSVTYRDKDQDYQVGRQRFLDGPTQATLYGSMVRAGGREIMDAAKVTERPTDHDQLIVAGIYQAFPGNLALDDVKPAGLTHGVYLRYAHETQWANLGVNLLRYQQTPGASVLGATGDYTIPVIKNELEFYGEAGQDPYHRSLTSFGTYFPGIFQRTGYDMFLEWARLSASGPTPGEPDEFACRIYKRISKNADLLLTTSHFSDGTSSVILGFSIGSAIPQR